MVRAIVDVLLGDVGRAILQFYEANSLVINILVLIYGFFMFYSWSNLVKIYRFLVVRVAKEIHLHDKLDQKSKIKTVLKAIEIPWAEVVDQSPFPFVGRITGLIPKRKSVAAMQSYVVEEDVVKHALQVLNGVHIRKIMPNYRQMIKKELNAVKEKS